MFHREACYYVSATKVNGYEAAVQCGMLANGARLAVGMNIPEINALRDTTPDENMWLGNRLNFARSYAN